LSVVDAVQQAGGGILTVLFSANTVVFRALRDN
jgi:hypothetical protein